MLSKDYLIRMISQGADVLARIIGLKKSGDYQDALVEINQNLEQLFGLDNKLIRLLDDESLYENLSRSGAVPPGQLEIIADLFREEGEILRAQGKRPESENSLLRSLTFYLMAENHPEPSDPIDVSPKMEAILQQLEKAGVPSKTLFELFCHYENTGQFASADELLNLLIARPEAAPDAKRERKLFYERLLEKEPAELSSRGIDRKLIQDKVKKL